VFVLIFSVLLKATGLFLFSLSHTHTHTHRSIVVFKGSCLEEWFSHTSVCRSPSGGTKNNHIQYIYTFERCFMGVNYCFSLMLIGSLTLMRLTP